MVRICLLGTMGTMGVVLCVVGALSGFRTTSMGPDLNPKGFAAGQLFSCSFCFWKCTCMFPDYSWVVSSLLLQCLT